MARTRFMVFALLAMALAASAASACPNCTYAFDKKRGQTEDRSKQIQKEHTGRGYNVTIMFMMPMPFLLLGGMAAMLAVQMRKHAPKLD